MAVDLFVTIVFLGLVVLCHANVPVHHDCPETDRCNGLYIETLQKIRENRLDCGKYARYLACIEDKLVQCSNIVVPLPPVSSEDNSTDADSSSTGNATYQVADEASEKLAKMKEVRTSLCSKDTTGTINIPSNYTHVLESFYNKTEVYARFDYYHYVHDNLTMQAGCDLLSNCTLILDPYTTFSDVFFPCSALTEFYECIQLYRDDCSNLDDLPSLSSSLDSIDKECQVGKTSAVKWSLLLIIASLMFTCR